MAPRPGEIIRFIGRSSRRIAVSVVGSVFDAFVAGVVLMIVVKRTGSLLPAIGAHYAIDVVLFA